MIPLLLAALLVAEEPCLPSVTGCRGASPAATEEALQKASARSASAEARLAGSRLARELTQTAVELADLDDPKANPLVARLLERADAILQGRPGARAQRAEVLGYLANLRFQEGAYANAAAHDQTALGLWKQLRGASSAEAVASRQSLGLDQQRMGDLEGAASTFAENVRLVERRARPSEEAQALAYQAETFRARGLYREAEETFGRALDISPHEDPTLLNNLAGLFRDQNRYAEAFWRFSGARRLIEEDPDSSLEDRAQVALNLAELSRFRGDLEQSEALYRGAYETAVCAFGAESGRLGTYVSQWGALDLARGRYAEAECKLRRALDLKTDLLGPQHPDLANTLQDLALALSRQGRHQEASSALQDGLRLREAALGDGHAEVALSRLALAELRWAEAPADPAIKELLDRTIASLDVGRAERRALARARVLRARIARDRGDKEAAGADLVMALQTIESLRPEAGGDELHRARFSGREDDAFELMVTWALEDGRPETALEWADRARARTLLDQLQHAHVDLRSGIETVERRRLEVREGELGSRLAAARTKLASRRRERPFRYDEAYRGLEREVTGLEEAYAALYEEIRNASPLWRGQAASLRTPSVADLAGTLEPGGLLLFYFLGAQRSFLFSISSKGNLEVFPLQAPSEERVAARRSAGALKRDILGLRTTEVLERLSLPLDVAERHRREAELGALYQVLVPTELRARALAASEVVVMGDVSLLGVPFEALVVGWDEQGEARYWVDRGPKVRYASSPSVQHELLRREPARGDGPLVSVSGVAFTNPAGEGGILGPEFKPLLSSSQETEALQEGFGRSARITALRGAAAQEGAVREALPTGRILHLATHGVVDGRRGEILAGLALAPPTRGSPDDGVLRLHEIYELRLRADLAVLSSCSSRRGPVTSSEGSFTLARAFLAAGARRVVASLWRVDDEATALLMSHFFRILAEAAGADGEPDYVGALAQAKRKVRDVPRWNDAFYWAPFVLEGAR